MKPKAIRYRRRGFSIGKIEKWLGIPRSTLSGWFRNVPLTEHQKAKLRRDWENALVNARRQAVIWHKTQKKKRWEEARNQAKAILNHINTNNPYILELALAILYSSEGSKRKPETVIGNSNPLLLKFFLMAMKTIYGDQKTIRCDLYLRADQNPQKIKKYWSKILGLPSGVFKQINLDKRTIGSKTYPEYKGVCSIRYGNVTTQRRLLSLADLFFERIIT